jgi:hypothetical protein
VTMSPGPGGHGSPRSEAEIEAEANEQRAVPHLAELMRAELLVPIRTSSGESPEPERVPVEGMRHGSDAQGRFLAAYTSPELLEEHGPPGSDRIALPARHLFALADQAVERLIIDPGAPGQLEISVEVLPFLAAGIDPNRPEVMRARRPFGAEPPLAAPEEIPEPFGAELRRSLAELRQVERAWLLRRGSAWTAGIQLTSDAELADFDEARNRLHALATEHLGSRRELAVTDLRAQSLRERYDAISAPFYVRQERPRGFLARLFGD